MRRSHSTAEVEDRRSPSTAIHIRVVSGPLVSANYRALLQRERIDTRRVFNMVNVRALVKGT